MAKIPVGNTCQVHNCNDIEVAKGLCDKHYRRLKRHGTTDDTVGRKFVEGDLASRHPLYETWRTITRVNGGKDVCEEWKEISNFVKDVGERVLNSQFKRRDSSLPYSKENCYWKPYVAPEDRRNNNAEKMKKWSARAREINPDYYRNADLKRTYGITIDDYNQMLAAQNNVCAVCGLPERRVDHRTKQLSRLAVDHCHTTGKVRGLLCHHCNAMLGSSIDSIKNLEKGIAYLRLHLPKN